MCSFIVFPESESHVLSQLKSLEHHIKFHVTVANGFIFQTLLKLLRKNPFLLILKVKISSFKYTHSLYYYQFPHSDITMNFLLFHN